MPGFEFKPRALVNGSAFVGFRKFTPKDATAFPEFTGLVANLGLSYTLLGATTFGVSYARDVNYSFEPLQPYFLSDSVGASVRQALGRRFDVQVSAGRAVYSYRDLRAGPPPAGAPPPLDAREDTTWNYAASLGYRPGPADPRRLRRFLLACASPRPSRPATTTASASGRRLLTGFRYAEHSDILDGILDVNPVASGSRSGGHQEMKFV